MARSCETQPRPEYVDAYREIQIIKESVTLFVQDMLFALDSISVLITGVFVFVCVHMAMMVMVSIVYRFCMFHLFISYAVTWNVTSDKA